VAVQVLRVEMVPAPKVVTGVILQFQHRRLWWLLAVAGVAHTVVARVMLAGLAVAVVQIMVLAAQVIPLLLLPEFLRKDILVGRQQVVFGLVMVVVVVVLVVLVVVEKQHQRLVHRAVEAPACNG